MSIDLGNRQPRRLPEDGNGDPWAEPAQMKEADAKRRKHSRDIGIAAGVLIAVGGAGAVIGSKFFGGESGPENTSQQPVAEAPANPAEAEEPVVTPEIAGPSSPDDITRLGEVTEDGEPVFTNEQIDKWFEITSGDLTAAQTFLPQYMEEHGADSNLVVNAQQWVTDRPEYSTGQPMPELYTGYFDDEGNLVQYFDNLNRKLLATMNMILASPELFDESADPHFGSMALRGTAGTMIDQIAFEGLGCKTDCTPAMDDALVRGLVEEVQGLPKGSVITDAAINRIVQPPDPDAGTYVTFTYRTDDDSTEVPAFKLTNEVPRLAPTEDSYRDQPGVDVTPLSGYDWGQAGPNAWGFFPHVPYIVNSQP